MYEIFPEKTQRFFFQSLGDLGFRSGLTSRDIEKKQGSVSINILIIEVNEYSVNFDNIGIITAAGVSILEAYAVSI
jgi:hypothetical protein